MEREIIETVLTEILEELKQLKTLATNNTNATLDNANRLTVITDKLESKQTIKPDIDTQAIDQIILSGLAKINSTINEKQTPVKREFRVLLFPEYNTREYFRIVFGRIIFWLVMLVIAKYLYLLGSAWIAGTKTRMHNYGESPLLNPPCKHSKKKWNKHHVQVLLYPHYVPLILMNRQI